MSELNKTGVLNNEILNNILSQNNNLSYQHDVEVYENILQKIKDMRVLSSYQINCLNDMPRHKLLYIISLYNMVIRNVNEIL